MINPEAVQEWMANPVTIEMMGMLKKEKQSILESIGQGHFFTPENMEETFGNTSKVIGVIEGIDKFFNLLKEAKNAED